MSSHRKVSFSLCSSFVLFILTLSQAALADWALNQDASDLYYITSKAAAVSELNSFSELSGSINEEGEATLTISLASVSTAVDIRNERMRDIVFEVSNYPIASISLNTDGDAMTAMSSGESIRASYDASIQLHGTEQMLTAELLVTKMENGGLQVSLAKPLIINAASFVLAESVE